MELTCISCKRRITNMTGSTSFKCPSCGEYLISRCTHCRHLAAKYTCPSCEFEGPN